MSVQNNREINLANLEFAKKLYIKIIRIIEVGRCVKAFSCQI
jgi:hypothetical protein